MNSKYIFACLALAASLVSPTQTSADQPIEQIPDLSLESIYHPDESFDFDGSLPKTHWVGEVDPVLVVQRDENWHQFDLHTGNESPWPLADEIARRIEQLGDLTTKQIRKARDQAIKQLARPNDRVVIKLERSLAVVSATTPAKWISRDATAWKNVTIDPSGRRLGYTRDGDMYLVDLASGQAYRLTDDGTDTILDGVLDWTYQEEIFGRGNYRGFWFSPNGNFLAMMQVDVSAIEPYTLAAASAERGRGLVRRYPKAGDPIPHAALWVWDLRRIDAGILPPATRVMQSTADHQRIITGVWWHPSSLHLVYSISDRTQSWREVRMLDASFGSGTGDDEILLLRETSSTWIDPPVEPDWLDDGSLVWRSELPTGLNRLYKIDVDGKVTTPISPEDFHVQQFQVAPDGSSVVVTGRAKNQGPGSAIFRIDLAKPNEVVPVVDTQMGHRADLSPDGRWFVDQISTAIDPPDMVVHSADGRLHQVIAKSSLRTRQPMTVPEFPEVRGDDGTRLPAMLVRPPVATGQRRCPVVIEIYGGPQASIVSNRWAGKRTMYRQLLASQGIGTLVIDNRSSAARGNIESWPIHRRVGEVEFQDLMAGVGWLRQQTWVDADRLAIRGWSFGGFLTLYAMTHTDAFAAGIAGGSVSDWREYDAFYTERYMGLPSENPAGYDATAPVSRAEHLQGRVLLIHGEADDNVHPSGTMRMALALQKAGKDFDLMIYPGSAHGITNPQQSWHLRRMTHQFLLRHLRDGTDRK